MALNGSGGGCYISAHLVNGNIMFTGHGGASRVQDLDVVTLTSTPVDVEEIESADDEQVEQLTEDLCELELKETATANGEEVEHLSTQLSELQLDEMGTEMIVDEDGATDVEMAVDEDDAMDVEMEIDDEDAMDIVDDDH